MTTALALPKTLDRICPLHSEHSGGRPLGGPDPCLQLTSYSPSKKVFLSSVLHDSHCLRTFFPSSFSGPEDPMFREEEREPPAGVAGVTPDTFPEDDAPLSLPWRERTVQ